MVAAAEGRRQRVSYHFSYFSPVNYENWFRTMQKKHMFLRFLIHTLKTMDGYKGSAEEAIKHIYREETDKKKKKRFA